MHYAKYHADNLETYVDEDNGLTYYTDGSVMDITGAIFYPGDDLYDAVTLNTVLSEEYLATRM